MADYRMNEFQETLITAITDIFHLRTTGGLDKKITDANLRKAMNATKVSVTAATTLDLSDYPGDLFIIANNSTAAFTLTLSNALNNNARLYLYVIGSNALTLTYPGPGGSVSLPVREYDGEQTYISDATYLKPHRGYFALWTGSSSGLVLFTTINGNTGLSTLGTYRVSQQETGVINGDYSTGYLHVNLAPLPNNSYNRVSIGVSGDSSFYRSFTGEGVTNLNAALDIVEVGRVLGA